MNNRLGARTYVERAGSVLEEAKFLYDREKWNLVVRRCQEVVELALKGALLWAGVDFPRAHDVGATLRRNVDRFPEFFACNVPRMASLSRRLRAERELSFYGDEETGLPPEELYSEDDAREALAQAEWAWELCDRLTQTS